jgi:hypothetical protein
LGPEEEFNKLTPKMFLSRDDTCCLLFEQQTFARWLQVGCRQRTGVRSVRIKTEVSWLPGWRILDAPATTFTAGAGNKKKQNNNPAPYSPPPLPVDQVSSSSLFGVPPGHLQLTRAGALSTANAPHWLITN